MRRILLIINSYELISKFFLNHQVLRDSPTIFARWHCNNPNHAVLFYATQARNKFSSSRKYPIGLQFIDRNINLRSVRRLYRSMVAFQVYITRELNVATQIVPKLRRKYISEIVCTFFDMWYWYWYWYWPGLFTILLLMWDLCPSLLPLPYWWDGTKGRDPCH